jgi:hypothetical protein
MVIRHKDVFSSYIGPHIESAGSMKQDWDNLSGDFDSNMAANANSFEECRGFCEAEEKCVQFALNEKGRCAMANLPKWGQAAPGVRSGWILDRAKAFGSDLFAKECKNELWIEVMKEEEKKD